MRNRFFGLRHGESLANRQALIVSDPALGTQAFGLSSAGRTEIRTRCEEFAARLGHDVSVVASDFLRTKETAEILGEYLTVPLKLNALLRERYFGEWDPKSFRDKRHCA